MVEDRRNPPEGLSDRERFASEIVGSYIDAGVDVAEVRLMRAGGEYWAVAFEDPAQEHRHVVDVRRDSDGNLYLPG